MDRDGHGHHGKYEGNKYSLNYLPFTKEQKFLLNTYDMIKLNLLNLFGLLKSFEFLKSFHVFCLLILMLLKKTIESDFFSSNRIYNNLESIFSLVEFIMWCFAVWWSIYFHLFSFMFISHLWTEEKSEAVAVFAPFITKSEFLQQHNQ